MLLGSFLTLRIKAESYPSTKLMTQLYIGENSSTLIAQIASIEPCIQKVHDWLLNNGLHLDPSKSEVIAFSNPRSTPLVASVKTVKTITVAGFPIKLQSSIKSLGVYLYSHMPFDKHVSEICEASYFHIRALCHIRLSLITEAAKTIAVAIVGSRLDYCNSLIAGTSASNLARLQLVQNTLTRVIAQQSLYCASSGRAALAPCTSSNQFQVLRTTISLCTLIRFI